MLINLRLTSLATFPKPFWLRLSALHFALLQTGSSVWCRGCDLCLRWMVSCSMRYHGLAMHGRNRTTAGVQTGQKPRDSVLARGMRERGTRKATSVPSRSSLASVMPSPLVPWRVKGACMCVPCPRLRVRCACSCLPCMFCFHTLGSGLLLRMAGVFKGAPVLWRGRPAVLSAMVVSFSGYPLAAVTISQRQLPPHTSTTNGFCIHNKMHLPPHPTAFANTRKGICSRNQRHLPLQLNSHPSRKA